MQWDVTPLGQDTFFLFPVAILALITVTGKITLTPLVNLMNKLFTYLYFALF